MSDPLIYMSARELLAHYRERTLSPVEVTQAVLRRIETLEPRLNAFVLVDEDAALAQARQSEARWQRGEPQGRLDGVPASIKDLVLTRGWPTLKGSRAVDPAGPWEEDAPCVARLREHGAVLLGKTTLPEFGWKGVTDCALTGITRNPWDLGRTPGGSSGGGTAALAAGMGALAIGTDGGGSIRIPAGFCGVFGIKANYGRVPAWPPSIMGTLAHIGPMARTVWDTALMLTVIAEPDPRDWLAYPYAPQDFTQGLEQGIDGLSIAYSPTLGYAQVEPEVAEICASAVRRLQELGARVEEVDPGFEDPLESFRVLWWGGAAGGLGSLSAEQKAMLEPGLADLVAEGARIPVTRYYEATQERFALGCRMRAFHRRYPLLATPALAVSAFEAGRLCPQGWDESRSWMSWTPFSYPFNLTQQPACSVPVGFTRAGLPVGLQLVADNHCEDLVLRAAHALEQALPQGRRPPL